MTILLLLLFVACIPYVIHGDDPPEFSKKNIKSQTTQVLQYERHIYQFTMHHSCGPILKEKHNTNTITKTPTFDELNGLFIETSCPCSFISTVSDIINKKKPNPSHTLYQFILHEFNTWLKSKYYLKEIDKIIDEILKKFEKDDFLQNPQKIRTFITKLSNNKQIKHIMDGALKRIRTDRIRFDQREKEKKYVDALKKEDELDEIPIDAELAKKIEEDKEMKRQLLAPPINEEELKKKVKALWIRPSLDYDFERILWLKDEIKGSECDQRQMRNDNERMTFYKEIYSEKGKNNKWIELVTVHMLYLTGETIMSKAENHRQSGFFKFWKADIPDIAALIGYTDNDHAQYEFSKTYYKSDKKQQQKYIIWAIAIKDAFKKYTQQCKYHGDDGTFCILSDLHEREIYHGAHHVCVDHIKLLQQSFVEIIGPFSTTTDSSVAVNFMDTDGFVWHFNISEKREIWEYYPMNAQWFSGFGNEAEILFYSAKLDIIRVDIWPEGKFFVKDLERYSRCKYRLENIKKHPFIEKKVENVCRNVVDKRYGGGKCRISNILSRKETDDQQYVFHNDEYQIYELEYKILMFIWIVITCTCCGILGACFGFVLSTFMNNMQRK